MSCADEEVEERANRVFREFLQANADLLRHVAHWGDGNCGHMHRVMVDILIGPKPTPPARKKKRANK